MSVILPFLPTTSGSGYFTDEMIQICAPGGNVVESGAEVSAACKAAVGIPCPVLAPDLCDGAIAAQMTFET
jgi:hypothetical protein